MKHILTASQLRKTYPPSELKTISSGLPDHRKAIIGQSRAVKALSFGLGNRAPGFNVYVSTPEVDDKFSVIQHFLQELAVKAPIPNDWCYVNNFKAPYCPNALRLPQGMALTFKKDIDHFITEARRALIKTLSSEEYAKKQNLLKEALIKKQQQIFTELNEKARKENFVIKRTPIEVMAFPQKEDSPMTDEEFRALKPDERAEIFEKQRLIQEGLESAIRKARKLEREMLQELADLEQKSALFAIEGLLEDLHKKYDKIDEIPQYLEDLKQDILDNLNLFLQDTPDDLNFEANQLKRSLHQRYEINVIVDNSELESAPILIELNPTYNNLFGKIERESIMGTLVTNFTLIRSGALHRANGGYLILPVEELLRSPFSWETLKRALRNQHIEIEDPTEKLGFISTKSLRPEPIPINVQIILIGQPYLFHLLYHLDSDFKKLFKVKADFDPTMKISEENLKELRDFIHSTCQDEKLLPVSNDALAKIFEYGHRLAGHQRKMTTQLDEIADILREANFYAQRDVHKAISAEFIQEAIREKKYRSNLIEEKIQEMIEEGVINIELEGRKTGQVNGLSVMDLGDIAFGRPSRITASASIGSGGIVDIEREAEMSGPIHTKGVLILSGFLFDQFGRDKQLNLSLSLVFEQNYGGVEGDSASSAELYAILSRLSGVPVRQGIAVTGSVDQRGRVQAVGGINEKIEGFFEVCKQQGLNGEQGVMIPASNVVHLMLQEEVVEAVANGQFRIWAVESIDEGIEILTDTQAGAAHWDEEEQRLSFDPGSVYDRVNAQLEWMSEKCKEKEEEKRS